MLFLFKPHEGDIVHLVSELWHQMVSKNNAELVLLFYFLWKNSEPACFFPHMTLTETLKLVRMYFSSHLFSPTQTGLQDKTI